MSNAIIQKEPSNWAARSISLVVSIYTCCPSGPPLSFLLPGQLRSPMYHYAYLEQNGYVNDMNMERLHHEIYLSDARKVAPEKWKTVIRHPIKKL